VVAQEGSLSRAATRLHMTQPVLGRKIHRVEADLRVNLGGSGCGVFGPQQDIGDDS
jgi:hypothetical protein